MFDEDSIPPSPTVKLWNHWIRPIEPLTQKLRLKKPPKLNRWYYEWEAGLGSSFIY